MKKKLILIVDDDPRFLKVLSSLLESQNYATMQATTGLDAIEIASHYRPDLIILDYKMPEGDGTYVMSKLKTTLETFTIPVIFLTAHGSNEIKNMAFRLSAAYFITKPYNDRDLLEKIKEILGE